MRFKVSSFVLCDIFIVTRSDTENYKDAGFLIRIRGLSLSRLDEGARSAFPGLRKHRCKTILSTRIGVDVVHSISMRRQAGRFMLLIVSLSSGLTRNPHPLLPTRKSITQGSGSV